LFEGNLNNIGDDNKIIHIFTKAKTKDFFEKLRESDFIFDSLMNLSIPLPTTKSSIIYYYYEFQK